MPIPVLSVGPAIPTFDMAAEDDGDDGYDFDMFADDASSHPSAWPEGTFPNNFALRGREDPPHLWNQHTPNGLVQHRLN